MPLNEVQTAFVNDAARPHIENAIVMKELLQAFVDDYDALQAGPDALPTDGTALDDGRTDAPALTGQDLSNLRNFSETMAAVITPSARAVFVQKMVRPLAIVLRLWRN